MICGIGIDIVEIDRIQQAIERNGHHFLNHVFTAHEQDQAQSRGVNRLTYFAGRWAAKEATAKALGTGFGARCHWLEIEISNDPTGLPVLTLSDTTRETAAKLGISRFHLSISHEKHYACAIVIAEKEE